MILEKQNKKMPEDNRYVDNRFQHQQQQNREQNQQLHTHGIKRLVRNPFFRLRQTLAGQLHNPIIVAPCYCCCHPLFIFEPQT